MSLPPLSQPTFLGHHRQPTDQIMYICFCYFLYLSYPLLVTFSVKKNENSFAVMVLEKKVKLGVGSLLVVMDWLAVYGFIWINY